MVPIIVDWRFSLLAELFRESVILCTRLVEIPVNCENTVGAANVMASATEGMNETRMAIDLEVIEKRTLTSEDASVE
jgi:hypothetical protein